MTPTPDDHADDAAPDLNDVPLFEADPETKARVEAEAARRAEMARWDASAAAPGASAVVVAESREGLCRWEARWRADGRPCPRPVQVGKASKPGVSGRPQTYCGHADVDPATGQPVGPVHNAVEAGMMRRREGREKRVATGAPVASTTIPVTDGTTKLESLLLAFRAEVEGSVTAIESAADRAATRLRHAGDLFGDITDPSAAPLEIATIQNEANERVLDTERKAREALLARDQALADLAANDEATEQLEDRTRIAEETASAADQARVEAVAEAARQVQEAQAQTSLAEDKTRAAEADRNEKVAAAARSVEEAQRQAQIDVEAAAADRDRRVADIRAEANREVAAARSRAEQDVAAAEARAQAEVAAAGEMAAARIEATQIKIEAAEAARAAAETRAGEFQQAATEADARAREAGEKARRDVEQLRAEHGAALDRERAAAEREAAALGKALELAEAKAVAAESLAEQMRTETESAG